MNDMKKVDREMRELREEVILARARAIVAERTAAAKAHEVLVLEADVERMRQEVSRQRVHGTNIRCLRTG